MAMVLNGVVVLTHELPDGYETTLGMRLWIKTRSSHHFLNLRAWVVTMVPLVKSNLTDGVENKECGKGNVEGEIFSMPRTIDRGDKAVEKISDASDCYIEGSPS